MAYTQTYQEKSDLKNNEFNNLLIQRRRQQHSLADKMDQQNDPLEKEADESAKKIVHGNGIDSNDLSSVTSQPQGKTNGAELNSDNQVISNLESSKGNGQPLDDSTQKEMESKMNTDLSDVRLHTDSNAIQASQDLGAQAFAYGSDIFFNEGKFDTASPEGMELLAHELTHTQQQKNAVKSEPQRMDDLLLIEDRQKKYKKWIIANITKDLGPGYELKTLQELFFGKDAPYDPEGWRNNIIRYYLLDRGWEAGKDPVPQWVEYKFIYGEDHSETLVVYTPIPGLAGRKAAFGFVRWDLGYGSQKSFYRYQGNKADYENANSKEKLEADRINNLNQKSGTTTKEEIVYQPGYVPLDSKSAILLAYDLVEVFEKEKYIQDPQNKNAYLDHSPFISLEELLAPYASHSLDSEGYSGKKASRRDKFLKLKKGENEMVMGDLRNLEETSAEKATSFFSGTTLGIAKAIFIEGTGYSADELAEEGLAANNLIQHFSRFKESVGKAVFFIHAYSTISENGANKARQAINSYKNTILTAYRFPMELADFGKGDMLLDEAYATVHKDVYGEKGYVEQRVAFAKEAVAVLKQDPYMKNNETLFKYIDDNLNAPKPAGVNTDKDTGNKSVDLKPVLKIELAVGIVDIMSQVAMLESISESIEKMGEYAQYTNQYLNDFRMILVNIMNAISSAYFDPDYENKIKAEIEKGRSMITEDYGEKIEVDIFLAETDAEMKAIQMQTILIGAAVISVFAGGILGGVVSRLVSTSLIANTSLAPAVVSFVAVTAEITTAALTTTVLMQTFESALTGKEWGEDFGKEFAINFVLFGVFKVVEVAILGRGVIRPVNAVQLGEGVWKAEVDGRWMYYVEESVSKSIDSELAKGTESLINQNQLARYPQIRAKFAETQSILKSQGRDPHLVENALKQSEKSTLEFFEKNPDKLIEATGKLPATVNLGPAMAVKESATFLDGFVQTKLSEKIWGDILATQPLYALDSLIPKSFELKVGDNRVWVHGNATEHLRELEINILKDISKTPEAKKLAIELILSDFQGALKEVTKNGVIFDEMLYSGRWEFKFAQPRQVGDLPALIHAQPK